MDEHFHCEECRHESSHTHHLLHHVLHNQEKIMAQIDELNTVLADIQTTLGDVAAKAATIEQDLINAQNNTGVDLSGPIATAQAIATQLKAVDEGITSAVVPPAPPAV